jgi:dienelactone hydrolase
MKRISRRQLGIMGALGAASAAPSSSRATQASQTAASKYTGPLDGAEGKVNRDDFDPVLWTRKRWESAPLKLTFKATTRKQAEAWQKQLRPKIAELLGGFPDRGGPLKPQTLEVRDFPGYKREKFVFESRPGVAVLGYLLTPAGKTGPLPAMICVPGHGRGVDDIVGIDDKGNDRTDKAGYQHDFAIQAVENGMAAVAIEPMAFGCRRDPKNIARGLGSSSCQPAAGAALLLGETMIGWRVFDVMRTIDWIETRRDLDSKRVGLVGISGGGTCTTFAAAVEPRIQVAYISGYLNFFRDSILSLSHCIDNYVPGILKWAEAYDVAGLIAPRPLFIESGEKDNIFPVAASIESFNRVKKVYELFGAADKAEQEVFPMNHSFWGKRGIPFAAKHLGAA